MSPRRNYQYRRPPNGARERDTNTYSLSLFNFFLQYGRAPSRRDIINSLVINPDKLHSYNHPNPSFTTNRRGLGDTFPHSHQTVKFQYHVPNTNLVVDKSISVLEDPGTQDVATWIEDLKQVAQLCGWDEAAMYNALRALLHTELFELVQDCESSEDAFKQLILFYYPESEGNRFYRKLLNVRQNNYCTIANTPGRSKS